MLCWLVVDDSDVIRKVARRILEDMNYLVLEAGSADDALDQCAKAMPEMILLDWHMPGKSGHDFLAELKKVQADRRPVVVYCTSENDPDDLARAFAGGAEGYMLKPFTRATLQAKVNEALLLAA
jgi:two-component system, chemotaxis family, chemotaxis protein CheY